MKNKFVKNVIETTTGAAILPIGMRAVRHEGPIGSATSSVMGAGLLKKTSKKFLGV